MNCTEFSEQVTALTTGTMPEASRADYLAHAKRPELPRFGTPAFFWLGIVDVHIFIPVDGILNGDELGVHEVVERDIRGMGKLG